MAQIDISIVCLLLAITTSADASSQTTGSPSDLPVTDILTDLPAHPIPLCTPVIHYFREQDVQTLSHAPYPLKRITLTRNQFQLRNDRLLACACSSFDEEQQGLNSTSTRPQWLGVSAGAQTFSWAFPDSWKRGRVAVKQVSYLTDFVSGHYVCGHLAGRGDQLRVDILLQPALFLTPRPEVDVCQPEIFLASTSAPLVSKVIKAVHGRVLSDVRCRCVGTTEADWNLFWERDGVQLSNDSLAARTLLEPEGRVIALNITADNGAYRTTFTCRSGPNRAARFVLETLSKRVATRLLGKGQTFVVGRETSLTCVSAGGNPAPRIKFILTRGNESRVYQPRSVHDTYPTTGNVALIQRKVSFIPDWSMYGWTIECQCSNAHHSVWNSTVNGLVPARGDQFLPDGNFEYRQLFWSGSSAETSRDSMAISLTEVEPSNNFHCKPSIMAVRGSIPVPLTETLTVNENEPLHLSCQCQVTVSALAMEPATPLAWSLRYSPVANQSFQSYATGLMYAQHTFTAGISVMPSRADTQPVYVCHGRNAEPAAVRLNVLSRVDLVQIASERANFTQGISNRVTCTALNANPQPLFRFLIRYANETLEEIPAEGVRVQSGLNATLWPPAMSSSAFFDLRASQRHQNAHIFCVAFRASDLTLMPRPLFPLTNSTDSWSNNIVSLKVHVNQGTPPVITDFYSIPSQPQLGERFRFFCLVDTAAPLYTVRAVREQDGRNVSYPVFTNQHIMLRKRELVEELGAHLVATREHSGRYRCEAWSPFGTAGDVFYDLAVAAPPLVEWTVMDKHRDSGVNANVIYVAPDESPLRLQMNITSDDASEMECWIAHGLDSPFYGQQLTTAFVTLLKSEGNGSVLSYSVAIPDPKSTAFPKRITCRAVNVHGSSAPNTLEIRVDTNRTTSLTYQGLFAHDSEQVVLVVRVHVACPKQAAFSTANATTNDTLTSLPLTQIIRLCPFYDVTEQNATVSVRCDERTAPGPQQSTQQTPTAVYAFDISNHTDVVAYRLEAVTRLQGRVYFASKLVNRTALLATRPYAHRYRYEMSSTKIVCITSFSVCAAVAAVGLLLLTVRKSRPSKQQAIAHRLMAANKMAMAPAAERSSCSLKNHSSFRHIQVLENDPVVVRICSTAAKVNDSLS